MVLFETNVEDVSALKRFKLPAETISLKNGEKNKDLNFINFLSLCMYYK